jgi:hypothetical protein
LNISHFVEQTAIACHSNKQGFRIVAFHELIYLLEIAEKVKIARVPPMRPDAPGMN